MDTRPNDVPDGYEWTPPPYVLSEFWPTFGQELKQAGAGIPSALGKRPLDIDKQRTAFTASHWHNFMLLYGFPC